MGQSGEAPKTASLPGTVIAAVALAGVNAFIGLFFPPLGLIWTAVYGAGAVGAARSAQWGYWLLVVSSALSWFLTLVSGRIDVISTTLVLFVLLMTPSARHTFGAKQS